MKAHELGFALNNETPELRSILARIKELENLGYAFEAAEASFELLARRARGEVPTYFSLNRFRIMDDRRWNARGERVTESEATVTENSTPSSSASWWTRPSSASSRSKAAPGSPSAPSAQSGSTAQPSSTASSSRSTAIDESSAKPYPFRSMLLADGPDAFAAQVLRLLGDPFLHQQVARNARRRR